MNWRAVHLSFSLDSDAFKAPSGIERRIFPERRQASPFAAMILSIRRFLNAIGAPGAPKNRVAWLLLVAALTTACGDRRYHRTDYIFGTIVEITLYDAENAASAAEAVVADLNALERRLHAWRPSELSRINAAVAAGATPIALSPTLRDILRDAADYSRQTRGRFNPAIGGLVELWGFHSGEYAERPPETEAIEAILTQKPSMDDLVIDALALTCRKPAVSIDLGGYAKGLALDRASAIFRRLGVKNALINIGGTSLALGQKGDRPWRIGIRDPRGHGAFVVLPLYDREAVGTSGDYQRFFVSNGGRYHHIIDPETGFPANRLAAATLLVRHPDRAGRLSDVFSKPLFISGLPVDLASLKSVGIEHVLVTTLDGKHYASAPMLERLGKTEATIYPLSPQATPKAAKTS